jgi:hypothetical protein
MNDLQRPLDLQLWLNEDLIRQQNFLKSQFISIYQEIGNAFIQHDFRGLAPNPSIPKISRGNDLNGLPYHVLDLIRDFDPIEGANIRLLNWFGVGCFFTLLLGRNRTNPIPHLLMEKFSFGLSDSQWNYVDLILERNQTVDPKVIVHSNLGFHHWIKPLEVVPDPGANVAIFITQIKKILAILQLAGQRKRN